ncbi:putative wall-associated receptor kinase-like 13 [Glycine max]|nr:putative wall-associated receptor kinase-like 13 [Glycine max]
MGGEIDMADVTVNAISFSFSWAVDSAIRSDESETASNLGASPAHSFGSVLDSAIRSSSARTVAAQLFSLTELKAATDNFSFHNRILRAGSIGDVSSGKPIDGREVAIKRDA